MLNRKQFYWVILFLMMGCLSENKDPAIGMKAETENHNFPAPQKDASIDDLNNYATSEWGKGNYQEALQYLSIAYQKAKSSEDEKKIANILNNLGLVHWRLGDNPSAMECYKEASRLAEKHGLKRLWGLTFTNQSLIQKEENEFDKAIEYNKKAIRIFQELNSRRDLAIAYNNHGQIFKNQH